MSVSAREELPGIGSSAVPTRTGTDARDTAGLLLARLTALPALLVLPFLLTSFPLLLLGWFKPAPVIAGWLLLAAVIVPMGWRRVPSVTGAADTGTASVVRQARTPAWVLGTLAAVAIAFGIQQTLYHSQYILVVTDPASYMQFAAWISQHGSLPISQNAAAFGGAPGLSFASPAFYQVGNAIVPQFMAGLPMALSLGFWAGGARVAVFMAPLLGAAAVFTFGGLTARLVGPRWAPVAALALGVSLPQQYTSRSTFSEPLAQILLLGGLALWIDSQRTDRRQADAGPWRTSWRSATHVLAALTGLMLGIALLVRIDAPADILPIVPFLGLLLLQRRRQVVPLFLGMLVVLIYGTVDGLVLSRPYLHTNASSVKPMVMAFAALAVVTTLAVMLLLRGRELPRLHPRLIDAAAIVPFVVLAAFVIRPYVQRNWSKLHYAPLSLHWVYWYIGGPVILLATIAAAMLVRRCLRAEAPVWVLPLLVFGWSIVEFLYRPAITPYQPWASRRLVPVVLPGLILLAAWLAAWLTRKVRVLRFEGLPPFLEPVPRIGVVACCAAALVVPPAITSFGLGVRTSGSQRVRLIADGLAVKRTYVGEIAAVSKVCAAIPPGSSALIVDRSMMRLWGEVIRGMCGVPTAELRTVTPANVAAAVRAIERAGRHPVLLAAHSGVLGKFPNGTVKKVMTLNTAKDQSLILRWPRHTAPVRYSVYRWEPAR